MLPERAPNFLPFDDNESLLITLSSDLVLLEEVHSRRKLVDWYSECLSGPKTPVMSHIITAVRDYLTATSYGFVYTKALVSDAQCDWKVKKD